jgi:hypothetical protein
MLIAALTGIGLTSLNNAPIKSIASNCIFVAFATSPSIND